VVRDAEHRPQRMIGAITDISPRKQAEAERERLIADLAAKNAELERFSYTVSHDLKSPLVTIRGYLDLLEGSVRDGNMERFRTDLQRIVGASEKMRQLLDDLLELSRIGRVVHPPEDVPFAELAAEAVDLRGRLEGRGARRNRRRPGCRPGDRRRH
jgi:signal transduction histidine kinase